jgi:predicted GIY-YIG superfamily endonuclease
VKLTKSKLDTHGHPTSAQAFIVKYACGQIYIDYVSNEQKKLSNDGEKDIGKYHAALTKVFMQLSEDKQQESKSCAAEWNKGALPDELKQKLVNIQRNPNLIK